MGISSGDLAERIAEKGVPVHYLPDFDTIEKFILEHVKPGDLLITMGAGNVVEIGNRLVSR